MLFLLDRPREFNCGFFLIPKGNDWSPSDAPKEKETPFFIV